MCAQTRRGLGGARDTVFSRFSAGRCVRVVRTVRMYASARASYGSIHTTASVSSAVASRRQYSRVATRRRRRSRALRRLHPAADPLPHPFHREPARWAERLPVYSASSAVEYPLTLPPRPKMCGGCWFAALGAGCGDDRWQGWSAKRKAVRGERATSLPKPSTARRGGPRVRRRILTVIMYR